MIIFSVNEVNSYLKAEWVVKFLLIIYSLQEMYSKQKDTDECEDNRFVDIKRVDKLYAVHTLGIKELV